MELFNRTWAFNLSIGGYNAAFNSSGRGDDSLQIEFDIKQNAGGGRFSSGDVIITGLKNDVVALLATNYSKEGQPLQPTAFSLELGYDNILSEVVNGNILRALPDFSTPDSKIKLNILSAYEGNIKKNVSHSAQNTTFQQLAGVVAKNNNLSLKMGLDIAPKVIKSYSFLGTPFQQIEHLRGFAPPDVDITIENKNLYIKKSKSRGFKQKMISSSSGLISTPQPSAIGCQINILLDATLNIGDGINLQNKKLPQLNGDYVISQINHKGASRGDLWLSILDLRRL